jgi:ABC-type transporter Mla MlaB component
VTEEPVVWEYDASRHTEPDESDVDALARLQLAAKRRGARLELYGASAQLIALLELAGLSEVLPCRRRDDPT